MMEEDGDCKSTPSETKSITEKMVFAPFSSQISSTFWSKFAQLKLDILGLNEEALQIFGYYGANEIPNFNPFFSVDHSSFEGESKAYHRTIKVPGVLINTNTAEQFKDYDKNECMRLNGQKALHQLFNSEGLKKLSDNPWMLSSFFLLTFADLKKYRFLYWFGFPAVSNLNIYNVGCKSLKDEFKYLETIDKLLNNSQSVLNDGYFLYETSGETGIEAVIKSISQSSTTSLESTYFGFVDPSSIDQYPGWNLRNYLVFIVLKWKVPSGSTLKIFSYRPRKNSLTEKCCIFDVKVEYEQEFINNPKFVGWEKNDSGKFGPRQVDLKSSLDPEKLAESSVDFNLKLMKWRLFPDFDLKMMHDTKVLILGAGTLGSNVARGLLGWGVRHITFVDNGNVSYSNPVRQSLYNFEDCLNGGKGKAKAAAQSLQNIFPGINAHHEQIMIPMPGHPVSQTTVNQVKKDFEILVKEVQKSDVIFLLMDTRESRWLPTLLGAVHRKIVINAALGFDSYLVMRHGMRIGNTIESDTDKIMLGCYYCTDVVAPGDSTRDRTLDQQCTVTRPGVSMIAGALAVEMLAALLHHPLKSQAGADSTVMDPSSPLGLIPHSIRGFLSTGQVIMPSFQAFDKCTACSNWILTEYEKRGFDFVLDVLNQSSDYLEKLTGLDKLKEEGELGDGIVELSDDEDI